VTIKSTILAILLLTAANTIGQSHYFRHYQVENGLSNNAVICSIQDKKGFLWFGTKDGLDRFDGYTFKVFRNDPDDSGSIGNNFIHSLHEDENGILWVGTENGLYQYNATTESFSLLKGSAGGQVREIQMDPKGNLWFIGGFTLFKYNLPSNQLRIYIIENYFGATSIDISSDGIVWVSSPDGFLHKYNPGVDSFSRYNVFQHSPPAVTKWIQKIYCTNYNSIFIGTSTQGAKLFSIADSSYEDILTYNSDKTEIFVRNFVETQKGEFWIATESGIFIYTMGNGKGNIINLRKDYNNPYSISDNAVYTFCKDKEGGIWAGTYFGGINYYPKHSLTFQKYFPEEGANSLSGNVVREIHDDMYGNLWIGTEDAGINKFDRTTGLFTTFKPTGTKESISYTNIHGLLATGNELWIGTFEHGLDVMNIKTGKVIRHYSKSNDSASLQSNFIYCIYQSNEGEIMVGTTIGAYLYNKSSDNFKLLPGFPLHEWYSAILKDNKGVIWAATYGNGVNYFDTKTKTSGNFRYDAHNKNSLSSNRVNSLFEDSNKNLWLATEGGLCLFDPKTNSFKRYTTKNGLPTNFILSVLEDDQKKLWVSTSKGLVCLEPTTERITIYTKDNGLLNDQFNFSSAFKDREGRMYFGSVKGLVSFRPAEFIKNDYTPLVYITGFQVNNEELAINSNGSPLNKSITNTEKISLTHNQSTFSIDFSSLSYSAPEMSEYAYKMEGLDKDWTYLKTNRKVYFTDLSAGIYTFKVKAANSNSDWSEKETSLVIEILPPWWASKLAYLSYAAVLLLLIYYFVSTYHQRVKEKNERRIEHLEIAKEKELYEAKIDFFTNVSHEIKTPLTLIKGPLEKVLKKAGDIPEIKESLRIMEKNTIRLVDLTNQLLDFRQTEIKGFSLNFTKENISELVEDIYLSFKPLAEQKNLAFTIAPLPAKVYAMIDVEAFNKILTNVFSNAVKYAKSKVEVAVFAPENGNKTFTIEVKNDGYLIPYEMKEKIFEPFFRLKETEKQKGTGIGLALSRSLTQLHKGILELKEPQNNMNIFYITMPVYQESEAAVFPE